jgi:hypothetical protein
VFRAWNLDERRINEWRLLVHGGAEQESTSTTAPEDVASRVGWVPLWRAFTRMAVDSSADSSADASMSYTPPVEMSDRRRAPTNAELTSAVRHLLGLP